MARRDWPAIRPFREFPPMDPHSFDPRSSPFIPVNSITDEQVHDVSIRRVTLLGAKVYNSGTQAIGDNNDFHDLTWDTASINQGGIWSADLPKRLTAPYTGPYLLIACAEFATAGVVGARRINVQLNGGGGSPANIQTQNSAPVAGFPTQAAITTMVKLMSGDYLIAQASQNSGTGAVNVAASQENSFFGMYFLGAI